jgi:hypothetical protein
LPAFARAVFFSPGYYRCRKSEIAAFNSSFYGLVDPANLQHANAERGAVSVPDNSNFQ